MEEKKNICWRCKGKGGFQQRTRMSEDDVTWDLCPECDGKGTLLDDDEISSLIKQAEQLKKIKKAFMTDDFTVVEFLRVCQNVFSEDISK